MQKSVIGYGSIFHKSDTAHISNISNTGFLGEHELFYAGRFAIKHVIYCILEHKAIEHIWLPEYYCPYVKNWLEQEFSAIKYYDIDPFDADAQIDWSPFSSSDLVIANNFWGLKENVLPEGERPIVIEDHSHGWLSKGCIESNADFCIASLRKTLPIPLGGIAWKPIMGNCDIPLKSLKDTSIDTEINPMLKSWDLIENAMKTKATCTNEEEKIDFLLNNSQGETLLRNTQEIVPLLKRHEDVICSNLFKDFNAYKRANLNFILKTLESSQIFKVITRDKNIPFGLLLAFKDWGLFTNFKQFLITNMIYPAELWPQNRIAQEYKFLLNIHLDFRYNEEDLEYMSNTINQWTLQQSYINTEQEL
ncbi:hypothetical protein SAMN04488008_1055 [Maribacter orientalis]|uniref:dTDP-4-amino-4,6-dideoxygalactose transaminase n=1 Tax=Maribacter orientalis TaxID=228957 RepID=A0A1H7SHV3_9FLAO|nr:hypothetical protein [Maribacter orientalis]SEL71736.1 hypothetical protein SAMN04488008_1055 [Maribacter orientalis]